jgi:DNA-binding MarR family transcriptional regulator
LCASAQSLLLRNQLGRAILTVVQATAVAKDATPTALAHDLAAFLALTMRATMRDFFRSIGEHDLSMTQCKALHVLDDVDHDITVKELAEMFGLSLAAASRTVEALLQRGFVERQEDTTDRRMKRVRVTPAGREVLAQLHAARVSVLEELAATMTDAQRRALANAIAPVLARDVAHAGRP